MSRIEKALEKAVLLRESLGSPSSSTRVESRVARSMDRLLEVPPLNLSNPFLPTIEPLKNVAANEEYRKLRSHVIRLTKGEPFLNTLMITSTGENEGKSITSLNLAISLAQEYDYTVLLVDADLRKPSLHKLLDLPPNPGLIQCLRGEATLEQALVKTGLGKLVVLPAGGATNNPVELLASSRMNEIVKELKGRYPERYVLFDTPPILPFADAQVLGSIVDGILFIVREGQAKYSHVQDALDSMTGSNLLGVIYNDASLPLTRTRYSYY